MPLSSICYKVTLYTWCRLDKKTTMDKYSLFLLIILLVSGCQTDKQAEETFTSEQALTAIAQTVDIKLSTVNAATITSTHSPTVNPSPTGTLTPTFDRTVEVASATKTPTDSLVISTSCDDSTYLSDVTVPDGSEFIPGEVFTKTWRIQNTGTCNWDSDYNVIFVDGSMMGAASPVSLPIDLVVSGGVVDISIGMIAPETPGSYIGYWRIQNPSQVPFGVFFYVKITVTGNHTEKESMSNGNSETEDSLVTPAPTRVRRFPP